MIQPACVKQQRLFNLGKKKERKTIITAVVHVDLPFISSEIANPSHCEIITHSMWQFLFFNVVSGKKDRHFATPEKRIT